MAILFEEILYKLAAAELDRTKTVSIKSTINNLLSVNERNVKTLTNAGWVALENNTLSVNASGDFNLCLPLKTLGFVEAYTRIVIYVK